MGAVYTRKLVSMLESLKLSYKNRLVKKTWVESSPALCYHSINEGINKNLHRVDIKIFEEHIKQLLKWGFRFLHSEEYIKERSHNRTKKITTLTFDDGYKSILKQVAPILISLEVPFTIFISTRLLEGKIFWRDKIRIVIENNLILEFKKFLYQLNDELSNKIDWEDFYKSTKQNNINSIKIESALDKFLDQKGISLINDHLYLNKEDIEKFPTKYATIGNHTHNHYRLSALNKEEQYQEINLCKKIIDKLPCNKVNVFAIPFGENGSFNQDTVDILNEMGFQGFFMTNNHQFGLKEPLINVNPYKLYFANRILPKNEKIIKKNY